MRVNGLFIFPFEKVKEGSNIILYGIGRVGRSFYAQATERQYCNIMAVADSNWENYKNVRYNIISPAQISEYDYDVIVLAVASKTTADVISEELVSKWEVEKEKIIYVESGNVWHYYSDANLSNFLESAEVVHREIQSFFEICDGDMAYFQHIIDEMHQIRIKNDFDKVEEIKTYLKKCIRAEESVKNQIVLLRILFHAGYFDEEMMKIFMHNISRIKSFTARMWLLYDITVIERNGSEFRYPNYYLDKRKIMEDTLLYYQWLYSSRPVKAKKNRVAIITFTLRGPRAAHNTLIVPHANEMLRQGKEVAIFPVELYRYQYGEHFIIPLQPEVQEAAKLHNLHEEMFDAGIRIEYNEGEEMEDRIVDFMEKLCEYAPEVVYDYCGEYAYLSPLYKKLFPVIALPMRGYASSACFDVYMCSDKKICMRENELFHSMREEQMVECNLLSTKQLKANENKYSRKDYGIEENDFVITTVGFRLEMELTIEFVDCVCSFIRSHSNVCWILVGGSSRYIEGRYRELLLNKKIIIWGYEMELASFYPMCDIYWNPNRMGAAGSIRWAMGCGLPIVITNFPSDILPYIGKENVIDGDYEACKEYVENLYVEREFYEEKSKLMKERTEMMVGTQHITKLLEVGENLYREKKMTD